MKKTIRWLAILLIVLLLAWGAILWRSTSFDGSVSVGADGKISASSGGQRFSGAGVTFIVPMQSSNVRFGPGGIDYKSEKLSAQTDGKSVLANGRDFGMVTAGDVVDFTEPGIVKVNGTVREAIVSNPKVDPGFGKIR